MDFASLITSLHPWILFLLILAVGISVAEFGSWLSRKVLRKEPKEGPVGSLVGSMLALLAFMLGFTFSITSSRFSSRKEIVIEEAKAISTCYLRCSLIPEKQRKEIRGFLREYTDLLVGIKDPAAINETVSRLEVLNLRIWDQAATLAGENMDSELRSLYIESVNHVLDIFYKRKTVSLVYRIQPAIWTTLLSLYILSMFLVGYEISDHKRRRILNTPIMTTAFALIVTLIADMDSAAYSRNFKVNRQPLIDVQKMMQEKGLN